MRSARRRLEAIVFGTLVDLIETLKSWKSSRSINSTYSTAAWTSASTGLSFSSSCRCLGSEPEFTPTRIGTRAARALSTTSPVFSWPPMFPGLMRMQWAPASIALSARVWLKWMSAITGIGDSSTIVASARTSSSRGTAQRTRSPPASAMSRIWRSVASTSAVSVLVIDCTATGAPPPIGTPPTVIWRLEATSPKGIYGRRAPSCPRLLRVQLLDLGGVLLGDRLSLELHGGSQLVPAGLPVRGEELELLDLLHPGEVLVARLDLPLDPFDHLVVLGEVLDRGVLEAQLLRKPRDSVGIERHEGDVVRALVPDGYRLSDQRAGRLEFGLDVGGRHVLARRVDDQLLLAVNDLEVAVLVEVADVAAHEEAVLGEGLLGLLRLIPIARHDAGPLDEHLAVPGQLDVDPRRGRPDRADLDPLRRVAGPGAGGLGHPPQLRERNPQRMEELDHLGRRRGRTHVAGLDLAEAEHVADVREHLGVGLLPLAFELLRHLCARLDGADPAKGDVQGALDRGLLLLVLEPLEHPLEAGLQFLPDPRHSEEPGRCDLGHVLGHLPRVGAAGDREAQHHRQVMAHVALRHVGHRQVRDHPPGVRKGDDLVVGADRLRHVPVRDLHPLGRPGGARGVDQGEEVVGRNGPPGGLEVEGVVAPPRELLQRHRPVWRIPVHDDHVLESVVLDLHCQHAVDEGLLGEQHAVAGIAHEILDLLRRVGVVDGEAGGAEVHAPRVGEVEFRTVREHHGHGVALADPQRGQTRRHVADPLRVLAPGAAELVALRAQGGTVGMGLGGLPERLAHGLGVQSDGLGGRALGGSRLHDPPSRLRGAGYLTWKPCPERRSMSFERPSRKSPMTNMKPTTPARSMTLKGTGRRRTFSTIAQKMWPPSSGRNGNRFTIASEREMIAMIPMTSATLLRIVCRVTS